MLEPDILDTPTTAAETSDRRRPGRDEAAPTLIPLLRHAADPVDLPQSQGAAWPEFSLAFEDGEADTPPIPMDARGERGLIIQIVATVCVICLAVAALSS